LFTRLRITVLKHQEHYLINGDLCLVCVPQLGGRLMDVIYKGVSLLFVNPELKDLTPDLTQLHQLPSRAKHIPFPLWGGEKTWVAPESSWPNQAPHPVLDSGSYQLQSVNNASLVMSSLSCPHSGLRLVRTITIKRGAETGWSVHHRLINESEHAVNCGIWSVMMLNSAALYCYERNGAADFECMLGGNTAFVETRKGMNFIHCNAKDEFKIGDQPIRPRVHVVLAEQERYLLLTSEASELS